VNEAVHAWSSDEVRTLAHERPACGRVKRILRTVWVLLHGLVRRLGLHHEGSHRNGCAAHVQRSLAELLPEFAAPGGVWSTFDDQCRYADWALDEDADLNRTVDWQSEDATTWMKGDVRAPGVVIAKPKARLRSFTRSRRHHQPPIESPVWSSSANSPTA
jgi:hypothetical protein